MLDPWLLRASPGNHLICLLIPNLATSIRPLSSDSSHSRCRTSLLTSGPSRGQICRNTSSPSQPTTMGEWTLSTAVTVASLIDRLVHMVFGVQGRNVLFTGTKTRPHVSGCRSCVSALWLTPAAEGCHDLCPVLFSFSFSSRWLDLTSVPGHVMPWRLGVSGFKQSHFGHFDNRPQT